MVGSKNEVQAHASTVDLTLPSLDSRMSTMEAEISLLRSQLRSGMVARFGPSCPMSILSSIENTLAMLKSFLQLDTTDLLRSDSFGLAAINPNSPLRKTPPSHGIIRDRMDKISSDPLTSETHAVSDLVVNDIDAHLYIDRQPFLPLADLSLDEQRCQKLLVVNSDNYVADSQDGADCLAAEAHDRDALSYDVVGGNTSETVSIDAGIEKDKSCGSYISSDSSEVLKGEIESTASILLSENRLDEYLGMVENPNEVILWDKNENIYLHPASGLQYDPTESVFYNWASQDENDLRTLFYKPVKGVIQLAQDDWYGEANRQLLNELDWDKERIFSDKSKGYHPDILSLFEEYLDKNSSMQFKDGKNS